MIRQDPLFPLNPFDFLIWMRADASRYSAVRADRNSLSITTMFPMAVSNETGTDPTPRTASENRSACTVY